MSYVTDEELVDRYRTLREPDDFARLVERHRTRARRAAIAAAGRWLGSDVDDVVQEAFLQAHERLASFRGDSTFGTWLYRIAFNLAHDHARRARRAPASADLDAIRASAAPDLHADEDADMLKAIERLPRHEQAVIRLHYWLGLSAPEIGRTLGMPAGTVRSHLTRGRQRLRGLLTGKT